MADPVRFALSIQEPEERILTGEGRSDPLVLETGQLVRGVLETEALEGVEFRELQVRFLWHTEGKGNRTAGDGETQTLERSGTWAEGDRRTFPFEIPSPQGPMSYSGKILQVLWTLEARLDRSLLKPDLTLGLPVILWGSPEPEHANLGPVPQKKSELEAFKRGLSGLWMTFGVVLMILGVIFGAAHSWEFSSFGRWLMFLLLAGGLGLTTKGMWGRLGRGKLGEPTVKLSTTELRRGEELRFSVAIRPEQRTDLRTLEAILECEERVVQGHGQYQSHHRRTVFEQRLSLAKNLSIEPHRGLRRNGSLTLPEDAPPSFGAPFNQVVWWLRFEGDIVGWPDWKEPFLLTVWP
jgi:hypothetical protein